MSLCRLEEIKWRDVQVGDILKLKNDEFVTVCSLFTAWCACCFIVMFLLVVLRLTLCCCHPVNPTVLCSLRLLNWMGKGLWLGRVTLMGKGTLA